MANMPFSTQMTLSSVGPAEVSSIRRFISEQSSFNLVPQSRHIQEQAANDGLLFKITADESDVIVGTALVSPVGLTRFYEMGNCILDPVWQGFGLQRVFTLVRTATFVTLVGEEYELVTAVDTEKNPYSLSNIVKDGFIPSSSLPREMLIPCINCLKRTHFERPRVCCSDFFSLPLQAHQGLVKRFLSTSLPMHRSHRDGRQITLKIICKCAYDPEVRSDLHRFAYEGRSH